MDSHRQDIALVERVSGRRITAILGPAYVDPNQLTQIAFGHLRRPTEVRSIEFFEAEREGPSDRLAVGGAAWRSMVETCRRLEAAHQRLRELDGAGQGEKP